MVNGGVGADTGSAETVTTSSTATSPMRPTSRRVTPTRCSRWRRERHHLWSGRKRHINGGLGTDTAIGGDGDERSTATLPTRPVGTVTPIRCSRWQRQRQDYGQGGDDDPRPGRPRRPGRRWQRRRQNQRRQRQRQPEGAAGRRHPGREGNDTLQGGRQRQSPRGRRQRQLFGFEGVDTLFGEEATTRSTAATKKTRCKAETETTT